MDEMDGSMQMVSEIYIYQPAYSGIDIAVCLDE